MPEAGDEPPMKPLRVREVVPPTFQEVAEALIRRAAPPYHLHLSRSLTYFEAAAAVDQPGIVSGSSNDRLDLLVQLSELSEDPDIPNRALQQIEFAGARQQQRTVQLVAEMTETAGMVNKFIR